MILRGFDYTLKEVIEFRGAPSKGAKRANEQRKVGILDEGKLAVNATLYGGTQHRAELTLTISPKHSTTTLSAARHIDINYVLTVRGILGSGTHLVMDVPVIVSNWPRCVSSRTLLTSLSTLIAVVVLRAVSQEAIRSVSLALLLWNTC